MRQLLVPLLLFVACLHICADGACVIGTSNASSILTATTVQGNTTSIATACSIYGQVAGVAALNGKLYVLCSDSPAQLNTFNGTTLQSISSMNLTNHTTFVSSLAVCKSYNYLYFADYSKSQIGRVNLSSQQVDKSWSSDPLPHGSDVIRTDDCCNVIVTTGGGFFRVYDKDGLNSYWVRPTFNGASTTCLASVMAIPGGQFIAGCGFSSSLACDSICKISSWGTIVGQVQGWSTITSVFVNGGYMLLANNRALWIVDTFPRSIASFAYASGPVQNTWLDVDSHTYYYGYGTSRVVTAAPIAVPTTTAVTTTTTTTTTTPAYTPGSCTVEIQTYGPGQNTSERVCFARIKNAAAPSFQPNFPYTYTSPSLSDTEFVLIVDVGSCSLINPNVSSPCDSLNTTGTLLSWINNPSYANVVALDITFGKTWWDTNCPAPFITVWVFDKSSPGGSAWPIHNYYTHVLFNVTGTTGTVPTIKKLGTTCSWDQPICKP